MNIVILGPQGSGKGTQAHLLAKHFGFFYLDAGAYLRELAKTDPQLDQIINERGALIPDAQMDKIIKDYLVSQNRFDNILFDGFPRTSDQFNLLEEFLVNKGSRISLVIFLTIPDQEAIRRLSARRVHKKTGEIYNLITNPPGEEVNLSDLEQRDDDTPAAIAERLKHYHQSTEPLINLLTDKEILVKVDGVRSIEAIQADLNAIVGKAKNETN